MVQFRWPCVAVAVGLVFFPGWPGRGLGADEPPGRKLFAERW